MSTTGPRNVLFIVENAPFPQDARVYYEAATLQESEHCHCYVIAPRAAGQRLRERLLEGVTCFRLPHYEAKSMAGLPLEFAIYFLLLFVVAPIIVARYRIGVIHVANPPDFIIPCLVWLKVFGVRFVFDQHDLAVETIKGKTLGKAGVLNLLFAFLYGCERFSMRHASAVIATNNTIRDYETDIVSGSKIFVVRNSNPIRHQVVADIPKQPSSEMRVGYFGSINNDYAAGIENFILAADELSRRGVDYRFAVIGSGAGLEPLRRLVDEAGRSDRFDYYGFLTLEEAFGHILDFDFGFLSLADVPKNHMHTAGKVMDYMCVGVPVCSLNLSEQLFTTGGIGIHAPTFEEIVAGMIDVYNDGPRYEDLRRRTLERFNESLAWEAQAEHLRNAYDQLWAM